MFQLDLIQTVALAGIFLFIGHFLCKVIRPLGHYNIPAPVVGGLLVSVFNLITHQYGIEVLKFDTALREPLMIAFFTTMGFNASLSLLKVGGPAVLKFFLISTIFAVFQNILGILVTLPFGAPPLLGVLSGSVTLTGGPATGLAFAPLFQQHGVDGAATLAVAAAMAGIVSGGLIGGPVGTFLINKYQLKTGRVKGESKASQDVIEELNKDESTRSSWIAGEDIQYIYMLKSIVVILAAMWIGSGLSILFKSWGLTLPAYIGAMIIAGIIRNTDDKTKIFNLPHHTMNQIGDICLSLFIVIALMTLNLWKLAELALPLITILAAQILMITLLCFWPVFQMMGRDYESAVITTGFMGFMLGTTANSMANMKVITDKYGPAPKAYLIVPIVGAFFIDFTNAIIITMFLNLY
ncbi:MAG: sodium/glutamate symporter [Syntrophothermus sp.]